MLLKSPCDYNVKPPGFIRQVVIFSTQNMYNWKLLWDRSRREGLLISSGFWHFEVVRMTTHTIRNITMDSMHNTHIYFPLVIDEPIISPEGIFPSSRYIFPELIRVAVADKPPARQMADMFPFGSCFLPQIPVCGKLIFRVISTYLRFPIYVPILYTSLPNASFPHPWSRAAR